MTKAAAVPSRLTVEGAVRGVAIAVWLLAPIGVLVFDDARRVFWTVLVASLPLLWVVGGFNRWRRICPLAAVSQLGALVGRPGKRKVSNPTWIAWAMVAQLGIMVLCLWLRLIAINGSGAALAAFLVLLSGAAAAVGFVYTGRTWCHYVCPVGAVERIYTEPMALRPDRNSQCAPCTACKKHCQDIDLEQGYWKETGNAARRVAYFAWPGIVAAFYVAYPLTGGTWDWYYGGRWAYQDDVLRHALDPMAVGGLPAAIGTLLVLVGGGGVSYGLFRAVESRWSAPDALHKLQAVAGFIAFNLFYFWAGQPTLRLLPRSVQTGIAFAIVAVSTAMLLRRLGRDEQQWVREKFARRLITRWTLGEAPANASLEELYVVHTEREREHAERLAAYRDTLRDLAAEGVLTRDRLVVLDALRAQLGISDAEHEAQVANLEASDRALFDPDRVASSEHELQRRQYRVALERAFAAGGLPSEAGLATLREAHGLSEADHAAILAELRDPGGAIGAAVTRERDAMARLGRIAAGALADQEAPAAADLVVAVARWRAQTHADRLVALGVDGDDWRTGALVAGDPAAVALGLDDPSPWLRAACALVASRTDAARVRALCADPEAVVREAAALGLALRGEPVRGDVGRADGRSPEPGAWAWPLPAQLVLARLTLVEAMILLRTVDLLRCVSPPELARLAERVSERRIAEGADLCREGEPGDDVYVLLSGRVSVSRDTREIRQLGPGAVIGELAALDPAPRSATVRALAATTVLVIAGRDFQSLLDGQPAILHDVLRHLVGRLRS